MSTLTLSVVRYSSFLLMLSLLLGCSREPNEQQLQQLYAEKINQTNLLSQKITQQKGTIIKLQAFEKLSCKAIENSKDYLCHAKVTVSLPFLGNQQNNAELHVSKAEQGWIIVD